MPKKYTKYQDESESDDNPDEEIVREYNLRKRDKPSSPVLEHKSPVSNHARNTSVLSESSILSEYDKSPNSSRGSRSSSDGYNSPNRNSPYTGSQGHLYPDLPPEPNQVQKGKSTSKLYSNINDSPNNLSKSPEPLYPTLNESREDVTDSYNALRQRNLNDNNSSGALRKECFINPKEHAKNKDETFSFNSKLFIIIVILVVFGLCYFLTSSNPSTTSAPSRVSPYESFSNDIDRLEKMFPNQSKRVWNTFKASSRHILADPDSEYPSVILMASQSHNSHVATCLAKLITRNFESVTLSKLPDFTVADIGMLKTLSSGEQKEKLDEKLSETFRQHKSVILDNLQSLSPEAALLLHGYCDNDNAPYKDVMMVLILHVDPNQVKLDPDVTNSVEKYLQGLWTQGLHEDKVAALLSRVANNIVVINAEDDDKLTEACASLQL